MIRLGIAIQETWSFFNEIYSDLEKRYNTSLFNFRTTKIPVFNNRINRRMFQHDMSNFMKYNDVVFFEWSSMLLAAASQFNKTCGIVTRLHRYEMYEWIEQINWRNVDRIILVSQAKKKEFVSRFPWLEPKIVVSSVSIDLDKFKPNKKVFSGDIGILCNLTPRKRVYDLVLNFHELLKVRDDFHLHIGGGIDPAFKDYYEALQQIVKKLNMQEKVTFDGKISDTPDWYRKIDIFISNSYSEGLQVAPMEAMASGCYCLSHHWDGAEELVPQNNLYYSGEELQEKILIYSKLPPAKKSIEKDRMRSIACEKFDIRRTIAQIHGVIDDVANANDFYPSSE